MTITFNFNTNGVTLDETEGLQDDATFPTDPDTGATADSDNDDVLLADDSNASTVDLESDGTIFYDRLFNTDLGFIEDDVIGVAMGDLADPTSDGSPITDVAFDFTDGDSSGLFDLDGNELFYYADPTNSDIVFLRRGTGDGTVPDPTGDIVTAIYLVSDADGTSTTADVDVWIVQFEAIDNPDDTDPDDAVALQNLSLEVSSSLDFNFDGVPSGQNYFAAFGEAGEGQLIVTGKDPVDDTEGPGAQNINEGDTVNSSKGGGDTTLGSNNQMLDPGDGLHFRFVTGQPEGLLVNGEDTLDQNEADLESNIQFTGYIDTTGATVTISQTQPGGGPGGFATVLLSAFSADGDATSQGGFNSTDYAEELD
ncbi:MAG: hypothetical protein ACYTAO_20630, partial [Planctomycetota bacterium]